MRKKFKSLFYILCFIFPKVIREQYTESFKFYSNLGRSLINKKDLFVNKNKKIVHLVNDIELLGSDRILFYKKENRTSKINSPKLYLDGTSYFRVPLEGLLPSIKIVQLMNVTVLGSTDALIYNDKMYHYELSKMDVIHDLKRSDIFEKHNNISNLYTVSHLQKIESISETCITLLKEHSTNYYHWMTECIPRLIEILKFIKNNKESIDIKKCTLLIDEHMPKQCKSVLFNLIGKDINIREVSRGELIKCQTLIYCTPLWLSLDNTKHIPNPKKEFFVDINALKSVRNTIKLPLEINSNYKKVYLQRSNSNLRKITNILEVERILYINGFDFVNPASLSFNEQLAIFFNVDIVIGGSGASFTNILFMKEGASVISLSPSAQSTNYYIFQPLADVSKVNLTHLLTYPSTDCESVHADAKVNIHELNKLLKEIL